MNTCIKIWVEY